MGGCCLTRCSLVAYACLCSVDLVVQSADKNFMVPVGGAIVAGPQSSIVDAVSQLYPGRASVSAALDLFVTLLEMGSQGYRSLLAKRKV